MTFRGLMASLIVIFSVLSQGCSTASKDSNLTGNDSTTVEEETISNEKTDTAIEEKPPKLSEFIIGVGDSLSISVYRHDDLDSTVRVDTSGKIMLPLAGDIHAANLSIFEFRDKLKDALSKYIIEPQIMVGVSTILSQKVVILGEVNSPGIFQIENTMTVLEAISQARGLTLDGKRKNILVIRGGIKEPQLIKVNLDKAVNGSDINQNIFLQKNDIVYVPRTVISNINRFFSHLSAIILPLLQLETGYFIGQQIDEGIGGGGDRTIATPTPTQ